MSKITLTNLVNLQNETTAVNAINTNNNVLSLAIDNTLSRDGTSPNQMQANIDMNTNRIINLPIPVSQQEPLRLADVTQVTQFQNSVNLAAALAAGTASASAAAGSASAASTSATNSATSATNSANSATSSSGFATAAAASAATAATYANANAFNIFSVIPSGQIPAIQNGTTTYDAGPVISAAITSQAGQPIYFPPGTYLIQTQIKNVNPATSGLTYGPQLQGSGMGVTIFKNQVAGVQLSNAFSTSSGSVIVTLAWPAHGRAVNDVITIANVGSHAYGGLDMEGNWGVTSVTTNTLTFSHYAAASSTVTNTGTGTIVKHMMEFDSAGAYMLATSLSDFQVQNSGSPVGSAGIQLRRVWNTEIDHVWINGATTNGMSFPCVLGDVDGPAQTTLRNCRFANCGRWGLEMAASNTTVAGVLTGHNEVSNTELTNITCDTCGSAQSGYQYGGAFKWKGQGIKLNNFVATTCVNCAIYIPFQGAGLSSAFVFDMLTLENNTGRQFVIEGLDTLVGDILELYNNDGFVATTGIYLHAIGSINNINIGASIIRATAGNNNYTAFVGDAANLGSKIRIYTPSFQNFGYSGQAQTSGITFLP
jgi:hypothetical protein